MRLLIAATLALTTTLPAAGLADDHGPTEAQVTQIMTLLEGMDCEMDVDDIEMEEGGGFELDDVYCADGQYDMGLDAAMTVTNKRKE